MDDFVEQVEDAKRILRGPWCMAKFWVVLLIVEWIIAGTLLGILVLLILCDFMSKARK